MDDSKKKGATRGDRAVPASSGRQRADLTVAERPQLVTADDAADMLSVSPRKLFSLTKKGEIPSLNIGRALRYDIADVWAFIASAKAAKR